MVRKAMVLWVALGVLALAVGGCTKPGPAPDNEFLGRPLVVADPGWNKGKPLDMGVTAAAFVEALKGQHKWAAGEDGAWVLTVSSMGSDGPSTTYVLKDHEGKVLLAAVKRGSKVYTPREIWGVAEGVAKAVREAEKAKK